MSAFAPTPELDNAVALQPQLRVSIFFLGGGDARRFPNPKLVFSRAMDTTSEGSSTHHLPFSRLETAGFLAQRPAEDVSGKREEGK